MPPLPHLLIGSASLTMSRAAAALPDMDAFANQPVVIDNGSGLMKAGFAGAELPKLIFPALSVKRGSRHSESGMQ